MVDLNDLVPEDSSIYMLFGTWINDAGEIVGYGVDKTTEQLHAFLARPAAASPTATIGTKAKVKLSPHVRREMERRVTSRVR